LGYDISVEIYYSKFEGGIYDKPKVNNPFSLQ